MPKAKTTINTKRISDTLHEFKPYREARLESTYNTVGIALIRADAHDYETDAPVEVKFKTNEKELREILETIETEEGRREEFKRLIQGSWVESGAMKGVFEGFGVDVLGDASYAADEINESSLDELKSFVAKLDTRTKEYLLSFLLSAK